MSSNGIQISENAVKWLVVGGAIVGFLYVINKWLDQSEVQIVLPEEAKDFASMPTVTPTAYESIEFHPEIYQRTEAAFKAEDYSGAVRHAVLAFFDLVRKKSGVVSDGVPLIQKVFRGKSPLLVFKRAAPTHIQNSEVGIIDMMEGFAKAIRNKHMHAETKMTKQEAILEINIASFLAIHVENNTVLVIEGQGQV